MTYHAVPHAFSVAVQGFGKLEHVMSLSFVFCAPLGMFSPPEGAADKIAAAIEALRDSLGGV